MPAFDEQEISQEISLVEGVFLLFFLFLVLVGFICHIFYVLRLWEEIPQKFARTTPLRAAWFLLIPFFNLYWMFVVFPGLYHDMNKAMESYGRGSRFDTSLITGVCVVWLVNNTISWITVFAPESAIMTYLSIATIVLSVIFLPMLWAIQKDVLEFIDIKSSMGK